MREDRPNLTHCFRWPPVLPVPVLKLELELAQRVELVMVMPQPLLGKPQLPAPAQLPAPVLTHCRFPRCLSYY